MTICFSEIARMEIKPDTNAVRRSDPSPKVSIDPVSVNKILSCSRAWHDTLLADADNPGAQEMQTEAPATAFAVPGGHGVHDSFMAPPFEKVPAGQLPDGIDRPTELQYLPGEHGVQSAVEALPAEKEPIGQSPLATESP
jgi:hypothetical protein